MKKIHFDSLVVTALICSLSALIYAEISLGLQAKTIRKRPQDAPSINCQVFRARLKDLGNDDHKEPLAEELVVLATWDLELKDKHCLESPDHLLYVVTVPQALVDRWPHQPSSFKMIESSKSTKQFLLNSFDSLTPAITLKKIGELAQKSCPQEVKTFCKAIKRRVDEVIKEAEQLQRSGMTPD